MFPAPSRLVSSVIYSPLYGFTWNQHKYKLPVGLLAQLVERCTSNAVVMGLNPVQAWIFFFRPHFHYCLSSFHYREGRFHIHKPSAAIRKQTS